MMVSRGLTDDLVTVMRKSAMDFSRRDYRQESTVTIYALIADMTLWLAVHGKTRSKKPVIVKEQVMKAKRELIRRGEF